MKRLYGLKGMLFFLILSSALHVAYGQTSLQLLKDINPSGTSANSSYITQITRMDDKIFFVAETALKGYELWVSDGTESGTDMVIDLYPGQLSPQIEQLTVVDDQLFFLANNGVSEGLWTSNGTKGGTTFVQSFEASHVNNLFNVNGMLVFFYQGNEIWTSDGTAEGTTFVANVSHGGNAAKVINGVLYFDGVSELGQELWRTNGTAPGTFLVKDINPGPNSGFPENFIEANGTLYFTVTNITEINKVWKSDGTSAGTQPIASTPLFPLSIASVNDQVFIFDDDFDLWKLNGSVTTLVKDFSSSSGFYPSYLTEAGGKLYFAFDDPETGFELWVSDGTANGTHLVKDIAPGEDAGIPYFQPDIPDFQEFKNELVFITIDNKNSFELWKSDGTESGTKIIREIVEPNEGELYPAMYGIVIVDDVLYWAADNVTNGIELWRSDGSAAGTYMVKNIYGDNGNSNASLGEIPSENWLKFKNELYFLAEDGTHGREVWKTNGTPVGTKMLKDLGSEEFFSSSILNIVGERLLLMSTDGGQAPTFWTTEGTTETTTQLIHPAFNSRWEWKMECNDYLYFTYRDDDNHYSLWKTNGLDAGTEPVTDTFFDAREFRPCECINNNLYFYLNRADDDLELWRTDGTSAGTFILKDNMDGSMSWGSNKFGWFRESLNNHFYFFYPDQVWRTDGTLAGTSLAHTFGGEIKIYGATKKIGNDLYFNRGSGTSSLWKTNGTDWVHLLDFTCALPIDFKEINGTVYFTYEYFFCSDQPDDRELWKTDGTPEGTVFIQNLGDYNNGYVSGTNWADFQGTLVLEGKDIDHGRELWTSDGTTEGTNFARELLEGPSSSNIGNVIEVPSGVYFLADDELGDRQIWKMVEGECIAQKITKGSQIINSFVVLNDKLIINATTEEYGGHELFSYDVSNDPTAPCIVTGVEDPRELSLEIYPNPTANKAVHILSDVNFSYKIFDLRGKLMMQGIKDEENETVDVKNLVSGNYIIIAYSRQGPVARKLMVK